MDFFNDNGFDIIQVHNLNSFNNNDIINIVNAFNNQNQNTFNNNDDHKNKNENNSNKNIEIFNIINNILDIEIMMIIIRKTLIILLVKGNLMNYLKLNLGIIL